MSLALSRQRCLLSQALSTDLLKMFPHVDLAFSHIPIPLEVEQHTTVLHVTGYYDHVPMSANKKKRVLARTCRHKEHRTGHQERRVRFCSYFIANIHVQTFWNLFASKLKGKTHYRNSKRNSSNYVWDLLRFNQQKKGNPGSEITHSPLSITTGYHP